MEKIENVANPSLVRVPQREMVYFSNVESWYRIGNITPHSNARCSLRHLGLSLCGQSFYCKSFEETHNVTNLSLARVPQRDMVCFCCLALCEKALNQTGNATRLSHAR